MKGSGVHRDVPTISPNPAPQKKANKLFLKTFLMRSFGSAVLDQGLWSIRRRGLLNSDMCHRKDFLVVAGVLLLFFFFCLATVNIYKINPEHVRQLYRR